MRHIQGQPRNQASLIPETLDDYVSADNPVRVIDAYIESLNLEQLGFTLAIPKSTGRKPYNPADLLKLYLYGYSNQVTSSRKLERACQSNVEVMWLICKLAPDHKTIANFRKDNPEALKATCRQFVQFCQRAQWMSGKQVAIDGSKFQSAGSKDQVINRKTLDKRLAKVDAKIAAYLQRLEQEDRHWTEASWTSDEIQTAIDTLKDQRETLKQRQDWMDTEQEEQHCATEPGAKMMRSGRQGNICGYNVQSAVDTDSGIIVAHALTTEGSDNRQLEPMAKLARTVLDVETLEVVADAGYSNGEQLANCEASGIAAAVPVNRAHNNQGKDVYQKTDFTYDAVHDAYICPAGEVLAYATKQTRNSLHLYAREGCSTCPFQPRCTNADKRWISRHFHEEAFQVSEQRLLSNPELMRKRMSTVERPFGVLKWVLGLGRFRVWGSDRAEGELSLGILSCNLNNVLNRFGVEAVLARLPVC